MGALYIFCSYCEGNSFGLLVGNVGVFGLCALGWKGGFRWRLSSLARLEGCAPKGLSDSGLGFTVFFAPGFDYFGLVVNGNFITTFVPLPLIDVTCALPPSKPALSRMLSRPMRFS
jgi:hypothetical protein